MAFNFEDGSRDSRTLVCKTKYTTIRLVHLYELPKRNYHDMILIDYSCIDKCTGVDMMTLTEGLYDIVPKHDNCVLHLVNGNKEIGYMLYNTYYWPENEKNLTLYMYPRGRPYPDGLGYEYVPPIIKYTYEKDIYELMSQWEYKCSMFELWDDSRLVLRRGTVRQFLQSDYNKLLYYDVLTSV